MQAILEKGIEGLSLDRSEWQLVKFGDVAIQQKQTVDRENTDLTRYVKGEHMHSEDIYLREWGKLTDEYLGPAFIRKFEEGDILYGSRRTYLRKVVIAPFDGITSNTTFVMKANEDVIDKRLLPFIILSEGFSQHSIRNSKGSVNPYVNWKDLADYEFLLPSKDQQSNLVDLLISLEGSSESEVIVQKKILEFKHAYQRLYFDSSERDMISIKEIAKVYSGGTPNRKTAEFWGGDIPWIKTAEVNYSTIHETEETITEKGLEKSATKLIPENSVLVAMYGQGVTRGRVAITGIQASCNQACAVIETNDDYIPEFVYFYLEYKYEDLRDLAHGANQQNLNLGMVKDFAIPKITKDKQLEIVEIFRRISKVIEDRTKKGITNLALKKSLVGQVF